MSASRMLSALALTPLLFLLAHCDRAHHAQNPPALSTEEQRQLVEARAALDRQALAMEARALELERQLAELETAMREQESADLRERLETLRAENERLQETAVASLRQAEKLDDLLLAVRDLSLAAEIAPANAQEFHQQLQPHGDWMELPDHGQVWQPSLAASSAWRPYQDGHWSWSRQGWMWMTEEPFGGVCYRYGRWLCLPARGWVWIPGTEWAPAWVSWRWGSDCVGWAPLPPAPAGWRSAYNSGCDTSLSISAGSYMFIETRHFVRSSYASCLLPPLRVTQIFHQTTNITNIVRIPSASGHVHVQCGGPERPRIEQACRQPVPRLALPDRVLPHRFPGSPPRLPPGQERQPSLADAFHIAAPANRLVSADSRPVLTTLRETASILSELPGANPPPSRPAPIATSPPTAIQPAVLTLPQTVSPPTHTADTTPSSPPLPETTPPARPAAVTYHGRADQKDGPIAVPHRPTGAGTVTGQQLAEQRQAVEAARQAQLQREQEAAGQRRLEQEAARRQQAEQEARAIALRAEQQRQQQVAEQMERQRQEQELAARAEQDRQRQLAQQVERQRLEVATRQEQERQRQLAEQQQRARELALRAEQDRQRQMAEQAERQRRELAQRAEQERQRQMIEQAERQRREMAARAEQDRQRQMVEQAERQRRELAQRAEQDRQRQMIEQAERQRREVAARADQERQRQMAENAERQRRERDASMRAEQDRQRQMAEQVERQRRDRESSMRAEQERQRQSTDSPSNRARGFGR